MAWSGGYSTLADDSRCTGQGRARTPRAQSQSVAVCVATHRHAHHACSRPPPPGLRQVGLRGRPCLAVPQWMQRGADCACARAGMAGLPTDRPPHTHAHEGGGGGPTCASGGVSSVHGRWRWLGTVERAPHPPLRGAGATLPHPLHTLTPPTAAMREGPRGATADALFYHARVGERARTPTCATPRPSNALTSESRRGLPAVLPVYPLTRVDTSK